MLARAFLLALFLINLSAIAGPKQYLIEGLQMEALDESPEFQSQIEAAIADFEAEQKGSLTQDQVSRILRNVGSLGPVVKNFDLAPAEHVPAIIENNLRAILWERITGESLSTGMRAHFNERGQSKSTLVAALRGNFTPFQTGPLPDRAKEAGDNGKAEEAGVTQDSDKDPKETVIEAMQAVTKNESPEYRAALEKYLESIFKGQSISADKAAEITSNIRQVQSALTEDLGLPEDKVQSALCESSSLVLRRLITGESISSLTRITQELGILTKEELAKRVTSEMEGVGKSGKTNLGMFKARKRLEERLKFHMAIWTPEQVRQLFLKNPEKLLEFDPTTWSGALSLLFGKTALRANYESTLDKSAEVPANLLENAYRIRTLFVSFKELLENSLEDCDAFAGRRSYFSIFFPTTDPSVKSLVNNPLLNLSERKADEAIIRKLTELDRVAFLEIFENLKAQNLKPRALAAQCAEIFGDVPTPPIPREISGPIRERPAPIEAPRVSSSAPIGMPTEMDARLIYDALNENAVEVVKFMLLRFRSVGGETPSVQLVSVIEGFLEKGVGPQSDMQDFLVHYYGENLKTEGDLTGSELNKYVEMATWQRTPEDLKKKLRVQVGKAMEQNPVYTEVFLAYLRIAYADSEHVDHALATRCVQLARQLKRKS